MRLAPCPRVCCYRQRAPFERTVARTCTWAVLRLTGVTLLPPFGAHAVPEASGARCRKDQPHPAPRIEDDRDAPSTGTGRAKDISPSHDVKNKIGTFQDYFSENQKIPEAVKNSGNQKRLLCRSGKPCARRHHPHSPPAAAQPAPRAFVCRFSG